MFRGWEAFSKIFLGFITKISSGPYKNMKAVFSRSKYQSNYGNLARANIILAIYWQKISKEKSVLVGKIGRASVFDVIRYNQILDFIAKNIISSKYEVYNNVESAINVLTHKCNDRCMIKTSTDELRYRMPNYCQMASDHTK